MKAHIWKKPQQAVSTVYYTSAIWTLAFYYMFLSHLKGALLIFAFFQRERLDLTCLTCKNKEAKYLCFYGIFVAYYLLVCCSDFDILYICLINVNRFLSGHLNKGSLGWNIRFFYPLSHSCWFYVYTSSCSRFVFIKKKKVKKTRRLIWLV